MNKDLTVGREEFVLWKFAIPLFGSIISVSYTHLTLPTT